MRKLEKLGIVEKRDGKVRLTELGRWVFENTVG